jgi:hypothetical protein
VTVARRTLWGRRLAFRAQHPVLLEWVLEEIPPAQCRVALPWDGPLRVTLRTGEFRDDGGEWRAGAGGVAYSGGFPRLALRCGPVMARLDVDHGTLAVSCDPERPGRRRALSAVFAVALPVAMLSPHGSPLHAGVVEWGGAGLVIAGPSGSGKSTLSLQLAREPASRFRGDELCLLTGDRRQVVIPLRRRGRPKARNGDRDAPAVQAARGAPLPVKAILFPRVRPAAESAVERLAKREAFLRLLDATAAPLPPAPIAAHLDRLAWLARSAQALAVTMGRSPECLPRLIRRCLEEGIV